MPQREKVIGGGLSFDNVRLVPGYSDIHSRYNSEISTKTQIALGGPEIELPIISSNMDTVTEARMAETIALYGGIGIIHRFLSPEDEADEIRKVKERMRVIEDNPPMVSETATIQDALDLLAQRSRGYVLVYQGESFSGSIFGIATNRDFRAGTLDTPIHQVMTPRERLKSVRVGTTLEEAVSVMKQHRVEKIPVFKEDGTLVGVYTLKDSEYFQKHPQASLDNKGRLMVGGAIGVHEDDILRAHLLEEAGADVIVLDIAHGHLQYTQDMLSTLINKEHIQTPIIAGNIATAEGALYILDNGGKGVKVGIGPGFVCETRDVAGAGVPQVTAILNVAQAYAKRQQAIPIIADGGIRVPGDIAIAIGAGADAVMIGSIIAGTEESPGEPVAIDGVLQKMVRGMASASAFKRREKLGNSTTQSDRYVPEGRTTFTPYKGKVGDVLRQLEGGLRSGMSYVGAHTIAEMKEAQLQEFPVGSHDQRRPLKT